MKDVVVQCHQAYWFHIRGVITAKIKFGTLLCFLPMRFLMFSLVFFDGWNCPYSVLSDVRQIVAVERKFMLFSMAEVVNI